MPVRFAQAANNRRAKRFKKHARGKAATLTMTQAPIYRSISFLAKCDTRLHDAGRPYAIVAAQFEVLEFQSVTISRYKSLLSSKMPRAEAVVGARNSKQPSNKIASDRVSRRRNDRLRAGRLLSETKWSDNVTAVTASRVTASPLVPTH